MLNTKGGFIAEEIASAFITFIICGIDINDSATAALISDFVRESVWSVRITYYVGNTKFHTMVYAFS